MKCDAIRISCSGVYLYFIVVKYWDHKKWILDSLKNQNYYDTNKHDFFSIIK